MEKQICNAIITALLVTISFSICINNSFEVKAQTTWPSSTPTILADYMVSASAGPGGTITPSGNMFTSPGNEYHFIITADAGYQIWDLKDNGVSKGAISTYNLTEIHENHEVEATFVKSTDNNSTPPPTPTPLADYMVTASASSGGTISPSGGIFTTPGESHSFTITPDAGYQILDVTDNGVSKGAISSYSLPDIHENHVIEATFAPTTNNTILIIAAVAAAAIVAVAAALIIFSKRKK